MTLLSQLEEWPRSRRMALIVAGTMVIGLLDYFTGYQLSFSIFYLLPVAAAAWTLPRSFAMLIAMLSTVVWLMADTLSGHQYPHPLIPFWNAGVRLALFALIAHALWRLVRAREMEEELTHFVVHDLRSPLTNVLTGLETLDQLAGDKLDEVEKELVDMGAISANRLLTLVNSLLDMAKIEGGQMRKQVSEVDLRELLQESRQQISVWAEQNGVSLVTEVSLSPPTAHLDRLMTMRTLVNLLGNAVKFSPDEGVVTLRVAESDAETLAFSVTDQGHGIPKEFARKVFDKFGQVEARKAGSGGTGLGLTFCRMAVEAQGGRIRLDSEEGKGTTVTFTLPKHVQES